MSFPSSLPMRCRVNGGIGPSRTGVNVHVDSGSVPLAFACAAARRRRPRRSPAAWTVSSSVLPGWSIVFSTVYPHSSGSAVFRSACDRGLDVATHL